MKNRKIILIGFCVMLLGILGGCATQGAPTYEEQTDVEIFKNVPVMSVEGTKTGPAEDYMMEIM